MSDQAQAEPAEGPAGGVALVTGASGALGAVAVEVLARRGLKVALHCHRHRDAAEALAATLDVESVVVAGDLADWGAAETLAAEAARALGPVTVLVHCAGVRDDGLLMAQDPERWARSVQVNLLGTFHADRAVIAPMLKARSGRIINVTSPVASYGSAGQTAYSASKAGVIGLTRSLAKEVGGRGVTVNALSPGFMVTAMTESVPAEATRRLLERTALGRPAEPSEMAPGIEFLLDAGYVTGQVIALDGGLTP